MKQTNIIMFPVSKKKRNKLAEDKKRRLLISEIEKQVSQLKKIREKYKEQITFLREKIKFTNAQLEQTSKSQQKERQILIKKNLKNKIDLNETQILLLEIDFYFTSSVKKREQIRKKLEKLKRENYSNKKSIELLKNN